MLCITWLAPCCHYFLHQQFHPLSGNHDSTTHIVLQPKIKSHSQSSQGHLKCSKRSTDSTTKIEHQIHGHTTVPTTPSVKQRQLRCSKRSTDSTTKIKHQIYGHITVLTTPYVKQKATNIETDTHTHTHTQKWSHIIVWLHKSCKQLQTINSMTNNDDRTHKLNNTLQCRQQPYMSGQQILKLT